MGTKSAAFIAPAKVLCVRGEVRACRTSPCRFVRNKQIETSKPYTNENKGVNAMLVPHITLLYAGILGIMAIALGATAGIYRAKNGIAIGDGGDPELLLRMRRHANFVENVPLALILFSLLEMTGVAAWVSHSLGIGLIAGRSLHWAAFGKGVTHPLRGLGAGLTSLTIAVSSVWCIVSYF